MKRKIDPYSDASISLRLIEESDLEQTLFWRNRDGARIWFKTSAELTLSQHQAWFNSYLKKDDDFLFIVEAANKMVGQASIYGIDWEQRSAEIGRFLAAPDCSGKGYIGAACKALLSLGSTELGLRYFFLEVMENNTRAIHLYQRQGFQEECRYNGLIRMGHAIDLMDKP